MTMQALPFQKCIDDSAVVVISTKLRSDSMIARLKKQ